MLTFFLVALSATAPASPDLGELTFPVTGNAACNARFTQGMLLLHSFVYDDAHVAFQAAAKADPTCGMAAWGDAMAYLHSLWEQEDLPAARAALASPALLATEPKLSAKERDYLAAARALTSEGTAAVREARWLAAADEMHRTYPEDDEVSLQDALALLVNNDDDRDVRKSMQAAALAGDVFQRHPHHPGAAHYLIHAFDSPEHAVLGLPAARAYAAIAPAASHALHMPAHIFVQLGMWPEVLACNQAAWEADGADAKKHHTEGARDWHTYGWILASELELGQIHDVERRLDEARALLATQDTLDLRGSYVSEVRAYVTHTGRWARLNDLLSPLDRPFPKTDLASIRSIDRIALALAGARAEAAMWQGDAAGVANAFAPTDALFAELAQQRPQDKPKAHLQALLVAETAGARAVKSHAAADLAAAVAAFQSAAAGDTLSGPAFVPPSREIAGELLAKLGQPKAALIELQAALEAHPNRAPSLLAAARAARDAGDLAMAKSYDAQLAKLWAHADADLPGLAELRATK